jgi:ATP-binding cassette subfamily B protein
VFAFGQGNVIALGTREAPVSADTYAPVRKTRIDPKDLPSLDATTLRRILAYVQPHWPRAIAVIACMVVGAALNLSLPWFMKRVIDDAIPRGDLTLLWLCCAAMVVGPAAAGLVEVVQKYGSETIGQQVMLDLRVALYRQFHAMPFAFFARQQPGEAVSHVLNDVQGVGGAVSGTLVDVAQNAIVLVSTIAFVCALDWRLALIALGFLPLFIAPTRRVGRTRKTLKRAVQARMSELTGILTETLSVSGALLVKVFGGEDAEVRRFKAKAEQIKRLSLEQSLVGRWFQMMLGLFEAAGPAIVFAVGGLFVIKGQIALGTLIAFVTVLKRLYGPARQLAGVHVDLMTSYAYFERVFGVLDRMPSIRDARNAVALRSVRGRIEIRDVSFTYDDSDGTLSNINLEIPAGATVGIVGPSGAGKSTIASLVMRLYDPTRGSITIDGVDLRDVTSSSLRESIAVVTQETFLFHATVLENLRYAKPSASAAEVQDAATRAQIHDVIVSLPDGYETVVGERGYRFSAGERQRLAIARAILKNPRILILDEATSSLDSDSEHKVQEALASLCKGRTTLVIAHRLSTVRDADLVVVVDRGRIVERGTHGDLIRQAGLYAWLWRVQASGKNDLRHVIKTLDNARTDVAV